jgi:putative ABC transport system permease protein
MIRHLLKLVWNRKRGSALLVLEIAVSFVVVFVVAAVALYLMHNWRLPLGYEIEGVWRAAIDVQVSSDDVIGSDAPAQLAAAVRELEAMEEVTAAAAILSAPYDASTRADNETVDGRLVDFHVNEVTDQLDAVLRVPLLRGRWFGPEDDGLDWEPVVIDRRLAAALYGEEDPIGREFPRGNDPRPHRVVGLAETFRKGGELSAPQPYAFERVPLGSSEHRPPRNIVFRVRPGSWPDLEARVAERLQAVVPSWSFEVRPLDLHRERSLRLRLVPLAAGGVVAVFLMVMVALGLVGVLGQSVAARREEIGLRRALGAPAVAVSRQVLAELLVIVAVGVGAGALVVVQLPLLGMLGFVPAGVYAAAAGTAAAMIVLLAATCGLYPGWMAARIQPAEALHSE